MHIAARSSNAPAIEVLIQAGGDKEARDIYGQTSLHLAAMAGGVSSVELLIRAGAEKEAKSKSGMTPCISLPCMTSQL